MGASLYDIVSWPFDQLGIWLEGTWLMQVRAPKYSVIENWRLALILRVLQLGMCLFLYRVILSYTKDSKSHFDDIPASASAWIDDSTQALREAAQREGWSNLCDANFLKTMHFTPKSMHLPFRPKGCALPVEGDWWQRIDKDLFIPTYITESQHQTSSGMERCLALQEACQGPSHTFQAAFDTTASGDDMCSCSHTSFERFVRGVGGLELEVQAQYDSTKDVDSYGSTENREGRWDVAVCMSRFDSDSGYCEEEVQSNNLGESLEKVGTVGDKFHTDEKATALREQLMRKKIVPSNTTRFAGGSRITMSIERWLEHALLEKGGHSTSRFKSLGDEPLTNSTSLLDVPNKRAEGILSEANTSAANHSSTLVNPPYRMTGIELEFVVNFYEDSTVFSNQNQRPRIRINVFAKDTFVYYSKPHGNVLHSYDARSGITNSMTQHNMGIRIRVKPQTTIRYVDTSVMISAYTNVVILWGMPELLIGGIALYLMSYTSNFYYYVTNERIRMKRSMMGLMTRALGWNFVFGLMVSAEKDDAGEADGTEENGVYVTKSMVLGEKFHKEESEAKEEPGLNKDQMCLHMSSSLRNDFSLDDPFANMVVRELCTSSERGSRDKCTASDLTQAAVADSFVTVQEFEEIFNDRQWNFLERLLLPPEERIVDLMGDFDRTDAPKIKKGRAQKMKMDRINERNAKLKKILAKGEAFMHASAINSKAL